MVVNASDVPVLNFPVERECVCSSAGSATPRRCLYGICRSRHFGPTILDFTANFPSSIIDPMPTSSSRQTPPSLSFSAVFSSDGVRWDSRNAAQHTGVVKTRITPPPYRRDGSQSSSPSTRCGPVSNGMLSRPLKLKHVSVALLVDFSVVDAVDETEVWWISCELTDGYHARPRQIQGLHLLYSLGKYKTEESIVPCTGFFMPSPYVTERVCFRSSLANAWPQRQRCRAACDPLNADPGCPG